MHLELSTHLIDLEILILKQTLKPIILHKISRGLLGRLRSNRRLDINLRLLLLLLSSFTPLPQQPQRLPPLIRLLPRRQLLRQPPINLHSHLLTPANPTLALLINLLLNTLLPLLERQIGIRQQSRLLIQPLRDEEAVHIRPQNIRRAHEVIEIEVAEFALVDEFVVVVDFAYTRFGGIIGIRIRVAVFGHFFHEIVKEAAPFRRWAELRDEEGVLLSSFVGCEEHAGIRHPFDAVEVYGRFYGGPEAAGGGVEEFDAFAVGAEEFVGCYRGCRAGGWGEVVEGLDRTAVALVFAQEWDWGAEVVGVDYTVAVAGGEVEAGWVEFQCGDFRSCQILPGMQY